MPKAVSPKLLGARFLSLERRNSWKPPVLTYAASHEESVGAIFEISFDIFFVCK